LFLWIVAAPAQRTSPGARDEGSFTFTSNVNVVVVPVQVHDSQGRAVGNLTKDDFQIFDRGKPQVISRFAIQHHEALPRPSTGAAPPLATPLPQSVATPERFVVFLFDDLHLGTEDMGRVQKAGIKLLADSLAVSDMAAVVSFSGTNTGLTRDRGKLQEAILKLQPRNLYQHVESDCPNIDYYQADLIANKHDGGAFEAAVQNVLTCANVDTRNMAEKMVDSAARQSLAIGEQDSYVTLLTVREFVRRMAALPGQRTLILVSPGFLTLGAEAMSEKSQIMDTAAKSDVTISALDARGLYTTELDASHRGADSAYALVTGSKSEYHRHAMTLGEDVMAELADGTGGTYFHNSNDLEGGFRRLTQPPEYLYLLEFSPRNVKPDATYHPLKVKVTVKGLKLQARRGYFAAKAPKSKK